MPPPAEGGSGGFDVNVDTSEVRAALERHARLSLGPFFASLAEDMAGAVSDNFASSGSSGGSPWQALAASTLKYKAAKGKSPQPLIFNGTWSGSPTVASGADYAEVGTNVGYAKFHVSDEPRSKIPLRNPYDLGKPFWDDVQSRLGRFIASEGKEGQ